MPDMFHTSKLVIYELVGSCLVNLFIEVSLRNMTTIRWPVDKAWKAT